MMLFVHRGLHNERVKAKAVYNMCKKSAQRPQKEYRSVSLINV